MVLQCVLLRILDTALDDGEEHLRLGFVELRAQSKFCDLEIQAGTKWVPGCFKYIRIQGIGSRWSWMVTVVGNVQIGPLTVWMIFDLDIVKRRIIWTWGIGFRAKNLWHPTWERPNQRYIVFFIYHTVPSNSPCIGEAGVSNQAIASNVAKEKNLNSEEALFQYALTP